MKILIIMLIVAHCLIVREGEICLTYDKGDELCCIEKEKKEKKS